MSIEKSGRIILVITALVTGSLALSTPEAHAAGAAHRVAEPLARSDARIHTDDTFSVRAPTATHRREADDPFASLLLG